MKKISIIIPIYNSERYIEKCIRSIIAQNYKELEIICINDGSIDNSEKIIKKMQKIDSRIILISKTNEGVSSSRNIGIEKSTGDYVMFVDADDYLEASYLHNLNNLINKDNNELIVTAYTEVYKNNKVKKTIYNNKLDIFEITYPMYINDYLQTFEYNPCWKQIIKSSLLKEKKIKFDESIKYGEDMLFNYICYINSKKTVYVKEFGYNYLIIDNSAMRKKDIKSITKYYEDNKKVTEKIKKIIQLDKSKIEKLYFKTLITFNNISSKLIKSNYPYKEVKKTIKEQRKNYNEIFKNYNVLKYGNLKQKVLLFQIKYNLIFSYYVLKKR